MSQHNELLSRDGELYAGVAGKLIGERLRRLRTAQRYSQTALAGTMARYGFPWRQQTVDRIETGTRSVRFTEACALADIFGVSLDSLAGRAS